MELEYKWEMPEDASSLEELGAFGGRITHRETIDMDAAYYDTPGGLISGLGGALRLRSENGRSVCCLKIAAGGSGGAKLRQEYEAEAADISEGLRRLPGQGAPEEVCKRALEEGVRQVCRTSFLRAAATVEICVAGRSCAAELAIDRGRLIKGDRWAPLAEVELEYKSGSKEAFHSLAEGLERQLGLKAIERSKSQRAMEL